MICKIGDTVLISVEVKVLAPFVHEDRIYYVAKADKSYTDTVWIITTDGEVMGDVTEEILKKASRAYKLYVKEQKV